MKAIIVFTILILSNNSPFTSTCFAQAETNKRERLSTAFSVMDNLLNDYALKNHLPGIICGIIVDGHLLHTATSGYCELDKQVPVSNKSAFRIASMTKSFTALAILKLRDEGKLTLDDPAYKYIPALKHQHYPTTDAPDITLRNLLTHSAGFPEDNPWGDRQLAIKDVDFIRMIEKGISFSNDPGIAYEYSNMGFAMLGYVIQKVSGKTYEHYITDNIFLPLGMTHTYWEYEDVPATQLAHGYRWLDKWIEQPILHDGTYGAMGGMITTMEDFSKYVAFQQSAWPASSEKESGPVKRSSLREMQHPWNVPSLNVNHQYPSGRPCPLVTSYCYGLGWKKDCEGRVSVGHSGGLPGFGSNWTILPDYGIGIVTFSNLTYAPAGFFNTMVLDTLLAISKLRPIKYPVSQILNQRKNELAQILQDWNNAQKSGIFAVNFFMDYFVPTLRKESDNIFMSAGKIIKVEEMTAENNLRGSFIIECEKRNVEVSFTLTPENPPLIQEYHIRIK